MEENKEIKNSKSFSKKKSKTLNDSNASDTKVYVFRNFIKELKRIRWPIEKKHNKNFVYIFIFIIILTGFFALISFGASQIIDLIGAK
ncbi:MAG: preprotein translocase subunit SecE [Mycoplasmataceae bacterium]|nr:preprotein translocase subunit SecE [Mycoplasmataceae bacterium]